MRMVPTAKPSTIGTVSVKTTANELRLHDSLRHGPRNLATEINDLNPLQHRLEKWEETQDNLKLNMQRELFGLHLPVRQLMERKIVTAGTAFHTPGSNLHLDILMGRDEGLDVADIFGDVDMREPVDVHAAKEHIFRSSKS